MKENGDIKVMLLVSGHLAMMSFNQHSVLEVSGVQVLPGIKLRVADESSLISSNEQAINYGLHQKIVRLWY